MTTKLTGTPASIDVDAMLDQCDIVSDAVMQGDYDLAVDTAVCIPLYPATAKMLRNIMGKDRLLKQGYDLTHATAEYGEGWLDTPDGI